MFESGQAPRVRRGRAFLTTVSMAMVLAACGGEDDGGDAGAAPGANRAPQLTGTPVTSIKVDETYSFKPQASDPDQDQLLFGIDGRPAWAEFDSATGTLAGKPSAAHAGVYRGIVVWVTDGKTESLLPPFDIVVEPQTPTANTAPTIAGAPAPSVAVGEHYRFEPVATDADGDSLTFTVRNRPAWATFDFATGVLEGVPTAAGAGVYEDIVIAVSDGELSSTLAPFSIAVTSVVGNAPPQIGGEPPANVAAGSPYAFTPDASDPDGDELTFSVSGAPSWASFDAVTGQLAGTPAAADAGTHDGITITVSDGTASTPLAPFSITVTAPTPAPNAAPTISGTAPRTIVSSETYTFTPTAADADGDTLTFAIANRPSWASFDPATGRLSGTPARSDAGRYRNIVISVSDGRATAALGAFSITVEAHNTAPTISGTPGTNATEGSRYTFTPTASDADGDSLTFSISNRPAWATFSPSTGRLTGTPGPDDAGTHGAIEIRVSDGTATARLPAFSISVSSLPVNTPPTISGSPTTRIDAGAYYDFRPSASDNDGDTLTFSIANRPSWASFSSSTGRLRGTPTSAGVHSNIRISVSDGQATTQLPTFSITVAAPPPPPPSNEPPVISGSPAGEVVQGSAYAFSPTASDDDGDTLTFSISNRPSWASFNASTGRLSGTPDAGDVGVYSNIRIGVSDGEAEVFLPAFSITVQAIALGRATLTWTPPTTRTDGSALTDLAQYKVYWGRSSGSYPNEATVGSGITSYVVEDLTPGTWYFVTTAVDSNGLESDFSNVGSKVIP